MSEFGKLTYLGQVRKLRKIAELALKEFPMKFTNLKFINHGENATFKVSTKSAHYLLRLHRNDYHTPQALKEELKWLDKLKKKNEIQVQRPIAFSNGQKLKKISDHSYSRYCDLLEWQEGKMRYSNLTKKDYGEVGNLLSYLHRHNHKTTYRKYWDAKGLIGPNAKLGSLNKAKSFLSKKEYEIVEECRKLTLRKIQAFEKKYPQRLSLIHADLHFGNIIWNKGEAIPIDFDDCGEGALEYDFAVIFFASGAVFKKKSKKERNDYVHELFHHYSKNSVLSQASIDIIDYYRLARHLCMLGWLVDRSSNPKLLEHLHKTLKFKMAIYKKALKHGPESIFS